MRDNNNDNEQKKRTNSKKRLKKSERTLIVVEARAPASSEVLIEATHASQKSALPLDDEGVPVKEHARQLAARNGILCARAVPLRTQILNEGIALGHDQILAADT